MKIGILFDHLHAALAASLRALLPAAEIVSHDSAVAMRDPGLRAEILAQLLRCDHVVTIDLPQSAVPLSTFRLRSILPRCHLLPPLQFAGYHPDVIGVALDGAALLGPTGALHSRIALLAYLTGHTPAEAEGLYNALVFARLGYFDAFDAERAALLRRFRAYRIDLAAIFDSWAAGGCFMHAPHTPRMPVMLDMGRLVCGLAGLEPDAAALAAELPDALAREPTHPLFGDIAARLGLAAGGDFTPPQPPDSPRLAFRPDVFLQGSFEAFRHLPRAALRAAPGVLAGLAALGLPEIDAPRAAARAAAAAAPADVQALLTWHGMLLQIDAGSNIVIQRRLRPEEHDATDLLTPHALLPDATPRKLAMLGGIEVCTGVRPNTASFRRGGLYLSAEAGRLAVRFLRDRAGPWESFLPLTLATLETLRSLLRGGWILEDGTRVPRASVRLAEGMLLIVGGYHIRLTDACPRLISAPGAPLQIAILHEGTELVLRPDPDDPAADIALDPPSETIFPPEIGSPEAFRAAVEARHDLPPLPENLHPALTVSNAQRAWTMSHHDGSNTPRLGRMESRLTLWRAADKTVLLGRGLEGIVADAQGVWKDHGFLLAAKRRANGAAASLLRSQPETVIEHPVCVFYNPNLQNYYHWIVEALTSLHVLAPYLPEGAKLLLPQTLAQFRATRENGFDHRAIMAALGFGDIETIESTTDAVFARDVMWLHTYTLAEMPAMLLRSFRDRAAALHPPPAQRTGRVYVKRRNVREVVNNDAVEALLLPQGFTPVYLEDLTPAEQIALFAGARFIVAPHGAGLANLLFCQPGTRVLEISPSFEFRPYFWMIAEKLGLAYGVLPCPTTDGTFNGNLNVDMAELRALMRLLRLTAMDDAPVGAGGKVRKKAAGAMARK